MGFGENPIIEPEKVQEAGQLLEDCWFFGNLLHTKTRTMPTSCPPPHPPLFSTQEHVVENERRKGSSFSSRKQPPIAPASLIRTPSLPNSREPQSFLAKKPNPSHNLMQASSVSTFVVGSDQEDDMVKNERKSSSFSSRKQALALPSLTRTPSLPTSAETQSFLMKEPNPSPSLARASSMSAFVVGSDQEDEEDQEREFTMGRLIRQASMNSSHTSNANPPRQSSKAMTENLILPRYRRTKPEPDQEKITVMGKSERSRSNCTMNMGKNQSAGGVPAIPGGWVDKSSSEDIKARIKFWARAVASNVRQEC